VFAPQPILQHLTDAFNEEDHDYRRYLLRRAVTAEVVVVIDHRTFASSRDELHDAITTLLTDPISHVFLRSSNRSGDNGWGSWRVRGLDHQPRDQDLRVRFGQDGRLTSISAVSQTAAQEPASCSSYGGDRRCCGLRWTLSQRDADERGTQAARRSSLQSWHWDTRLFCWRAQPVSLHWTKATHVALTNDCRVLRLLGTGNGQLVLYDTKLDKLFRAPVVDASASVDRECA
jgi:hypothetical protein